MANNYTEFSQTIDSLTDAEKEWITQELTPPCDWEDPSKTEKDVEDFTKKYGLEDPEDWPSFSWNIDENSLWIYSEECGNSDNVAAFVSEFLKKFRPTDAFAMEIAFTCSKPRVGEFGGGCIFVTKDGTSYTSSCEWAHDRWKEHRAKYPKAPESP